MRKILLILSAASISACSSKDRTTASGNVGGTAVLNTAGDAGDLFPPLVNEANARLVQDLVFDRLADMGDDMNTVGDRGFTPRLAKSWTWAPDSLSIAFSIDPRARWHDGKPVTASDIRYSFKVFTDPKVGSPATPLIANIDSVSVRDSLTAVVWYKKHTPEQFYDMVWNVIPMPEHVYGAIRGDSVRTSEATRTLVGSGRFKFVKWEPKVRIELIADTANYRGRAKLDRVIITPQTDPAASITQVLSGATDFMENYPIDRLGELDSSKIARPLPWANSGYVFLGFNAHARKNAKAPHPILSDIRVRRAIAMGLDRTAMVRNVFGTVGKVSHGPFPSNLAYADTTLKLPPFDTTAAKALLDSAGWKPGADGIRAKGSQKLELGLLFPGSSSQRKRFSVLIQDQLRKLGVQVNIDGPDNMTSLAKANAGDFDMQLAGYNVDPGISGAKQNWSSASIGQGGLNTIQYGNPKVDALLDSATVSFDPAKRREAGSRAFQTIIDDVPAVFLYDIVLIEAVNRRFDAQPTRPDGWSAHLADWSIPADKRIDRDKIGLAPSKP